MSENNGHHANGNGHSANGNGHATNGHVANGHAHVTNDYSVPRPRAEWIVNRKAEAARTGDWNMSLMHFAR
jgi:phosphomethylpyrimidine synthase